jgi:hypothetical protein
MGRISKVSIDPAKDIEGIWIDYVEDIRLKIARMGNPKYEEEQARLTNLTGKTWLDLSEDQKEDIIKEAASSTVLVDWENLQDDEDEIVEYSSEQALQYFKDQRFRYFYRDVMRIALSDERYRANSQDEAVKN